MKQGIASFIERRQATALSSFGGLYPRETSLPAQTLTSWVKHITLQNIASAQVLDRPCFCSSSHAPNCTCMGSHHH